MSRAWFPFYVGDYIRKTAHLSLLEHGAYHLLIDHYMASGNPLPNDPTKLYRICRARSPSERKAVLSVAYEFFTQDGTLMRNKKCDSELNKQLNFSNSQSAKAKLRHSHGNAGSLPTRATTTPTPTPTPTHTNTPLLPTKPHEKKNGVGVSKNGNLEGRFDVNILLSEDGREAARKKAPGWDIYHLAKIYNEGISSGKREPPRIVDKAFPAWCRSYTKGNPP